MAPDDPRLQLLRWALLLLGGLWLAGLASFVVAFTIVWALTGFRVGMEEVEADA